MTQAPAEPRPISERESLMGEAPERTLTELFRRQAQLRANEPAMLRRVDGSWKATSWGEYAAQARQLAAWFMSVGLEEGGHVAIWSFNRPEFVVASTATLLSRACTAPMYQTLSADEAAHILAHSEAPIAVVENRTLLAKVLEVRDRLPALLHVVLMEGEVTAPEQSFVTPWGEALAAGSAALADIGHALDVRSESVRASDVATLIYTSGTMGPPKAVLATHRNLIAAVDALGPLVWMSAHDRVLSYLPLAHVLERINSEGRLYFAGSPLWFTSTMAALPDDLRDVRPTCFVGVPRVWEKMAVTINAEIDAMPGSRRRLARWAIGVGEQVVDRGQRSIPVSMGLRLRHALADRMVLRRIRAATGLDQAHTLISGAAPISPDLLRFFHGLGLEILEGYGMTENMSATTVNRHGHARLGTVGQAVPGVEVRIADDGEILMRGDVVFAGYYKDDAATAETVVDGWLHTGDVGAIDADGYLRITDRKKDLIITAGGKNISPTNIENALRRDLIGNAVVIGDRRPFLSALLTIDASALADFAARHGLGDPLAALVNHEMVREEVRRYVEAVNRGLAVVEQVRRWAVLSKEFSVGVELTPTFKVRRKVVAERFAMEIEGLYAVRDVN
jgi:long-chain acyl-CoA synthetase